MLFNITLFLSVIKSYKRGLLHYVIFCSSEGQGIHIGTGNLVKIDNAVEKPNWGQWHWQYNL